MKRRELIKGLSIGLPSIFFSKKLLAFDSVLNFSAEKNQVNGPFKPNWESLKQFKTPDWFRDAKFGIWAHWGPQCQPEQGDWYARLMYNEGSSQYNFHIKKYGHPSKAGFKEVINEWKAENWNPDQLVELYKNAGAKYFVGMANHHDNFDNYKSKHQPWNSVNMGPKKDIIGGWAKAVKKHGLHFGVSVHSSHAWSFYETAQRSDKKGELKGVPYDGNLQKKDGKNKWWKGYDPEDLYAQNHELSEGSEDVRNINKQWDYEKGANIPDKKYCDNFLDRTIDLIDQYNPDLIYFDDTALPLWPISDAGLKIAAHYYNQSIAKNGELKAVLNGKVLNDEQRKCMVWDIEKGRSDRLEPFEWQTCTCLGSWHYNKSIFDKHSYKNAKTVIHYLIDIVSKNGNLLLSVPVKGDGTIDADELAIVTEIGKWITPNGDGIFGTRPWKIFGEGPAQQALNPLQAQGFNEGGGKAFSELDYRFTQKDGSLYVIGMGWPETGNATIKSLSTGNVLRPEAISKVELLGGSSLNFKRTNLGLEVELPKGKPELNYAYVLKLS